MEFQEVLARRRSCRAYSGQQVSEAQLTAILQAANAAPVGLKQYQDVSLTVVQEAGLRARLDAAGAAWLTAKTGRPSNHGPHPTYNAPTLIVVCAKKMDGPLAALPYCNASCIIENMLLAATEQGLGSVYLLGMAPALAEDTALCAELRVPEGFFPAALVAVGEAAAPLTARPLELGKLAVERIK